MAEKKKSVSRRGQARKKARKKRPRPGADPVGTIVNAALKLTPHLGWRSLTMADIARETGLSLSKIHAACPGKASILNALVRRIDDQVLGGGEVEGDSVRDRLFELLMRRFDALDPHKPAIAAIVRDTCCNPAAVLATGPSLLCSMISMLKAADVSVSGLFGAARIKGLGLIYANTFRVWLNDSSEDMGKTMAALDKGLRMAERMAKAGRGG